MIVITIATVVTLTIIAAIWYFGNKQGWWNKEKIPYNATYTFSLMTDKTGGHAYGYSWYDKDQGEIAQYAKDRVPLYFYPLDRRRDEDGNLVKSAKMPVVLGMLQRIHFPPGALGMHVASELWLPQNSTDLPPLLSQTSFGRMLREYIETKKKVHEGLAWAVKQGAVEIADKISTINQGEFSDRIEAIRREAQQDIVELMAKEAQIRQQSKETKK